MHWWRKYERAIKKSDLEDGVKIKLVTVLKKKPLQDVAKGAGISRWTLSNVIHGKTWPSPKLLQYLSDAPEFFEHEDYLYRDTGCSYHSSCLTCPFPECKFDIPVAQR